MTLGTLKRAVNSKIFDFKPAKSYGRRKINLGPKGRLFACQLISWGEATQKGVETSIVWAKENLRPLEKTEV